MWKKALTLIGWIVLINAGITFRSHAKELLEMNLNVPHTANVKVIIQLVVGFLCILVGRLASLRLRNVRISPEIKSKPMNEVFGRSDFMVFNHRGKSLAQRAKSASS